MDVDVVGRSAPRILRANAAELGTAAADQGFDHVLWTGGGTPPAIPAGTAVLIDLHVDRAPAGAPRELFAELPRPTLDPRRAPALSDEAMAAVAAPDEAARLGEWLAAQLRPAVADGIRGARLLGLQNLPPDLVAPCLVQLRAAAPDALLFGWTPGLPWHVLAGLPPGTLDWVASSLPWWDGYGDWLWRELELLRRIGTVIADAGEGATPGRQRLAVLMADGWMTADAAAGALGRLRDGLAGCRHSRPVGGTGGAVVALQLTDTPDPRRAGRTGLALLNTGAVDVTVPAAPLLAELGNSFGPFTPPLRPDSQIALAPSETAVFTAVAAVPPLPSKLAASSAEQAALSPRLAIEAPSPCVDGGRFPARRTLGSLVAVEADVIGDGHDTLAAVLRWQGPGDTTWTETPMRPLGNDRWTAEMPLNRLGLHRYTVQAWKDVFSTFTDELAKKFKAGVPITLELQEGAALVAAAAQRQKRGKLQTALNLVVKTLSRKGETPRRETLLSPETAALMAQADDRPHSVSLDRPVPLQAERTAAGFASWYEIFPRSMSDDPARHGTFRDVVRHLPRIQGMGFDVLYFPPIHPIGRKNRKGRNNTLTPAPDDPGSPYAIGSEHGGHDALHPELGTIEDFQHLRTEAARHGLELALDFAIQASPDHPWLTQHKEWFNWRPDGTIRYAENPPKRYEDIVNVDFYAPGAVPGLWIALAETVLYWAREGVRLFRVDNPHTKPLPFWEWMIAEVQSRYPDTVFLAEAFTRPKVMYRLAKVGFSQSYTYFTWREQKWEFVEYLTELTRAPVSDFFRPHFFVNTPDINPVPLQTSGRPGYLIRAALATTLSGLWGLYCGFELCEGTPVPGREEYLDSEKYQIRAWDWDRPGNIVPEITRLNAIRKLNPALHTHLGISFLDASNDQVLFFEKATPDRSNVVLVAINLDHRNAQSANLSLPFWRYTPEPQALDAADLVWDVRDRWYDRNRTITLTPDHPYAIWRISPAGA